MGTLSITDGIVLADAGSSPIRADVLVVDGVIHQVGTALEAPPDAHHISASGRLVMPGLVNAHTHSHSAFGRGMLDGWRLEQLLLRGASLLGPRTPEDLYLGAALNAIEMVEGGCTGAYDMVTILPMPTSDALDAVVQAYTDVGMRAIIAPAVADLPFLSTLPGLRDLLPEALRADIDALRGAPATTLLATLEGFVSRYGTWANGRIRAAVAPSIPTQCSDELLDGCIRLADVHATSFHTHLAETRSQAVEARRRWGTSLVEHLHSRGAFEGHVVGAHGVWLGAQEHETLAAGAVHVVHNPASNAKLGSGTAQVAAMRSAGISLALGTDGSMTSDNQNMFEAMRMASYQSRTLHPDRQAMWLDATACIDMATAGGGRALDAPDVGSLRPGARADITIIRTDEAETTPLNDPRNALVFAASGAGVETVIVDGEVVAADGRATRVDRDRILDRAREAAERAASHRPDPDTQRFLDRLEPFVLDACAHLAVPSAHAADPAS